jgi:hypothetical protein
VFEIDCQLGEQAVAEMNTSSRKVNVAPVLWFYLSIALAGCSGGTSVQATQRQVNSEFKFSVEFPSDISVCTATSGEHPHGFFVRFEDQKTDCRAVNVNSSISGISIDAYFNTAFWRTLEDAADAFCEDGDAQESEIGAETMNYLAFNERRSLACVVKRSDGSIDVFVVTQAGEWPGPQDSSDLMAPYINYTASLHTTKANMARDLSTFRRVLDSVIIDYPK